MTDSKSTEFLTSGEAARVLGVAVETVRLWERTGQLVQAFRTAGGRRIFRRQDIERLARLRAAKQREREA